MSLYNQHPMSYYHETKKEQSAQMPDALERRAALWWDIQTTEFRQFAIDWLRTNRVITAPFYEMAYVARTQIDKSYSYSD